MKLHRPLLVAVVDVVYEIFAEGRMADKAIQYELKSSKRWGSKDRAFIATYSYNIVRWWRLFHYINGTEITYNDKPTIWKLLGIILILDDIELINLSQFAGLQPEFVKAQYKDAQATRKIRESIPDWLDEIGAKQIGKPWDDMIHALNHQARVALRVNTSKTNLEDLKMILKKDEIYCIPVENVPSALYLEERKNVFGTKAFQQGYFEVQDPGSQMIAAYLDVAPNMRVIDACAGAGGKTLHLSNLMENKGTIIAMDTQEWKLKELRRRAKRNGAFNIDTRPIENSKVIKRQKDSADRVLLDVPCSGTGVLRRNPDAKWKLDQVFLDRIINVQADIISRYSKMVKPGGKFVYATCSILPSENEDQVKKFLKENPNYELEKQNATSPHEDGFDGFYMALIKRNV